MTSSDEPPPPLSWADIASAVHKSLATSASLNEATLARLKVSVSDTVRVDAEMKQREYRRFQLALYGKLFGKSPPFEMVKTTLMGL